MTRRELIDGITAAGATFIYRRGDAMPGLGKIKILFIAGFGPIVRDADASRKLYVKALEIPFKEESGGYLHTDALQGAKEFALWPLSQAAESCFGNSTWPDSLPAPHAWLEFDVDNVENASGGAGIDRVSNAY
jgi:hypothetical protein